MGKYKIALLFVVIFAIGSTIFNIVGPKILGKATTEIFTGLVGKISGGSGIDFTKIGRILATLLCLYLCSALFSFIQGYIMTGVSQKLTYRMRREISEKISRLPMNYFDKMTHGEILSRITNDVDTLSMSLNQSATQVITSVTTIIGVLIMMLSISPLMTVIALLILPLSMGLISVIVKRSQKFFKSQQRYLGHVNGQVEEVYGGHSIVKAFNKEKDVIAAFDRDNEILYQSAWKSQFLSGMMMPIMQFWKSWLCGCSHSWWLPRDQEDDRSRRYPVIYPIRKKFYPADPAGSAGGQHASVHGSSFRARVRVPGRAGRRPDGAGCSGFGRPGRACGI